MWPFFMPKRCEIQTMPKKRRQYDDAFRASAVAALTAAGYPDKKGALSDIARQLDINWMTLSRWAKGTNNPPPHKVVEEQKKDLADVFESIAYKMLDHAALPDTIKTMSGKDAVIAAATATDKMRLLRDLPTEIIAVIPRLVEALQSAGMNPNETFERMIRHAHERAASNRPD